MKRPRCSIWLFLFSCLLFHPALSQVNNDSVIFDTVKVEEIIYEYDTLIVYDTVYEGGTSQKKTDKGRLSVCLFLNPYLPFTQWSSGSADYKDYMDRRSSSENPALSFSTGALMRYTHNNHWLAEAGIAWANTREKAVYNINIQNMDSTKSWNVTDNSFWDIDTLDSYFQIKNNDTLWFYITDSNQVIKLDSLLKYLVDTTYNSNDYNGMIQYTNIEIPLIYGRTFQKGKFFFAGKAGIITCLLIKTKGTVISEKNINEYISIQELPFAKTSFRLFLGADILYPVNKYIALSAGLYYKRNISPVLQKSFPVTQSASSAGIHLGISYIVNH